MRWMRSDLPDNVIRMAKEGNADRRDHIDAPETGFDPYFDDLFQPPSKWPGHNSLWKPKLRYYTGFPVEGQDYPHMELREFLRTTAEQDRIKTLKAVNKAKKKKPTLPNWMRVW